MPKWTGGRMCTIQNVYGPSTLDDLIYRPLWMVLKTVNFGSSYLLWTLDSLIYRTLLLVPWTVHYESSHWPSTLNCLIDRPLIIIQTLPGSVTNSIKVGFEVEPKSVSNMLTSDDHKTCKISQGHEFQEIKPSTNQVTFSYSVNWEKSETRWASRWDMYLEVKELVHLRIT